MSSKSLAAIGVACAIVAGLAVWWLGGSRERMAIRSEAAQLQISSPADQAGATDETERETPVDPAPRAARAEAKIDFDAVKRFSNWSERYLAARPEEKASLEAEGMRIAEARRSVFKQLIQQDPRRALAEAVPMLVRQQLPDAVVALLERRVSGEGPLEVQAVSPDSDPEEPTARWIAQIEGVEYRAFVYGRRLGRNSIATAQMNGVGIDRFLAVNESPLRVLEKGEIPPREASVIERCPVSGKTVPVARDVQGEAPATTRESQAVQVGKEVIYFCDGGHIRVYEEELIAGEGGTGGTAGMTAPAASSFPNGPRTLLYMRLAFPDDMQEPQTEAAASTVLRMWFTCGASVARCAMMFARPMKIFPSNESLDESA